MKPRLLITGANGFIGRHLVAEANARGHFEVIESTRQTTGDIDDATDWSGILKNIDVVVHTAGLAHTSHSRADFERVNFLGTRRLLQQCRDAKVSRLVFLSSIGVQQVPRENYAESKLKAEELLQAPVLSAESAESAALPMVPYVIVRPPLVYGPDAPGNFRKLRRLILSRWPCPLGAIDNRRAFIGIDNLTDFLLLCASHPGAAGHVFPVADNTGISVASFVRAMANAAAIATGVTPRIVAVPEWILRVGGALTGKGDTVAKLCDDLPVDISPARDRLGWTPPTRWSRDSHGVFPGTPRHERVREARV